MRTPFEQAVTAHGAMVLRVCRSVLGAGADAEDAWSETFLAALAAWPDLPEGTNVPAWLTRVAKNKAIDVVRGRRAIPVAEVPERAARADPEPSPVWAQVAALPERQRLALAYHYLGGLPHTETARLIGGTPAAVRRAAADGLAALRKRLGPEWKEG